MELSGVRGASGTNEASLAIRASGRISQWRRVRRWGLVAFEVSRVSEGDKTNLSN